MNTFTFPPLWAILPGQTEHVFQIYNRQLEFYSKPPVEAEKKQVLSSGALKMLEDGNLDNIIPSFSVKDGVGILHIEGIITPKADFFTLFFGGFATLDLLERDFLILLGREDVHTIILDIDSPGGNAFGVQQFAHTIFEARAKKSIIAVTSGMMASAAMWIGAAAHKIFITGDVTVTGSIGTVTSHVDISEMHRQMGIKMTKVAAGKFKQEPSMLEPLSDKGRAILQDQVNHANGAFVNDMAKFRGVKPAVVNKKMADGKTFIGTQAIDVDLIDGLFNMESIISGVSDKEGSGLLTSTKNNNFNNINGGKTMIVEERLQELKASDAELYNKIFETGVSMGNEAISKKDEDFKAIKVEEYNKGIEAGKSEGAKAEHKRIADIRSLADAGNLEMIEKFIADETTHAPEAAVEILKAQKAGKVEKLTTLKKEAPKAVDTEADANEDADKTPKQMSVLVSEYVTEHKCSRGAAIVACAKAYPDAPNDFIQKSKGK
jgi:signal peptide peptidase SppA